MRLLISILFLSAHVAMADVIPFNYYFGKVLVVESKKQIVIHAELLFTVSILPGGKTWPELSLDEHGMIYVGNVLIEPVTATTLVRPKVTLVLAHDLAISEA